MTTPYTDDLRSRVVKAMCSGMSCREAADRFDIAPSTAGNWHQRHRETNSYSALPMGGDYRSKLTAEADWIAKKLAKSTDLTLADVRDLLAKRYICVSYASVWRTARRLGLRYKKNAVRN
jgi:transposase